MERKLSAAQGRDIDASGTIVGNFAGSNLRGYVEHVAEGPGIQTIDDYSGEITGLTSADLKALGDPVVLRGIAANWPIVRSADAATYLRRFDSGEMTEVSVAGPEHRGAAVIPQHGRHDLQEGTSHDHDRARPARARDRSIGARGDRRAGGTGRHGASRFRPGEPPDLA